MNNGDTTEESPSSEFVVETMRVSQLREHPRNYRSHPKDQVEHLMQSIREHGLYRNIVVARDATILAGHGVVQAVKWLRMEEVPVVKLDVDPDEPRALKVLAGDNEVRHLSEIDDRALTAILRDVHEKAETGLKGTGFDEMMLANLVFVSRPAAEVRTMDEAAEWVGMPEYQGSTGEASKIVVNFATVDDRKDFLRRFGMEKVRNSAVWWPPRNEIDDVSSVKLEQSR